MSYYEVSVVVDGALDQWEMLDTSAQLSELIKTVKTAAKADKLPTEVYVLVHNHPADWDECDCEQYLDSHKPDYAWNVSD